MRPPSPAPKNLVVKRGTENDGNSLAASWGNPADALWESDHKWNLIDETWWFNASKNMTQTVTQQRGSGHATGDIVWVRDKGIHDSNTMWYDRTKYHPLTVGRYLPTVLTDIYASNDATRVGEGLGTNPGLAHAKFTFAFKTPRPPEISDPEFTASTGTVKFTVTTDEGKDDRERYDTMYCITRQDSSNRGNSYSSEKVVVAWASTTEASKDVSVDIDDVQSVTFGQWVKVTCKAYSRGLAGDSATVTKVYYYSYPAQGAITSIVASGLTSTDIVTVRLNTNATSSFPVDSLRLQRLYNTTITNATAAGLATGWQDVPNAIDNGVCSGFSDQVSVALPEVRKHTWYRLVSTHGSLTRNSLPVEAACLYRPKDASASDTVQFVSIEPGNDGSSIIARIAWNNDSSTTTQISWSQHEDAWESTEQPTIFDVDWEDSTAATGYNHSATITIRGLDEGVACYVRARRAKITDSITEYGAWCNPAAAYYPVYPVIAPTDVTLFCDAAVERGKGVDCRWTYSGSRQTAWQICNVSPEGVRKELLSGVGATGAATIPASAIQATAVYSYALTEDESIVEGKTYYTRSGGSEPYTYTEVASPDVEDIATYYERSVSYEQVDKLRLTVSVTAGGKWAESNVVPVMIEDAPGLAITAAATLTAQPLALTVECTSSRASVAVKVTSRGVSTDSPTGSKVQAEGDVVWAAVVTPNWVASSSVWTATITAPTLDLYDGAIYDVLVSATDAQTLLSSDDEETYFSVAWEHQATCPSQSSAIITSLENLSAGITPVAPTGAAQTDVCDVYRLTPDGAYLIAPDVTFGTMVVDRYAPFSNRAGLAYRLCTRTADGDVDWCDRSYALSYGALRFDWGNEALELPYNIVDSDSWDKGFELRPHMDGEVAGYWDGIASRKATLSTDVMKVESHEKRKALASLAKHAGPVFVRTPDGAAFPANVTVDSYGATYDSQSVPVSLNATEVVLTQEYKVAPNDWEEEEDEEVEETGA